MDNPRIYSILIENRFWSKVAVRDPTECWLWNGSLNGHGYGQFHLGMQKYRSAHRLSWELTNGPIPKGTGYHGTCVLHRCDVPRCVNPNHLWLGTCHENNTDRTSKGRDADRKGERHVLAKLNEKQILEIRTRYANGDISQQRLGDEFGVSQTNIGMIVRQATWGSVDGHPPVKRRWAKHAVPRTRNHLGQYDHE